MLFLSSVGAPPESRPSPASSLDAWAAPQFWPGGPAQRPPPQAAPAGDLLDVIREAEREQRALQADAQLLQQTLGAQTALLQRTREDARSLGIEEKALKEKQQQKKPPAAEGSVLERGAAAAPASAAAGAGAPGAPGTSGAWAAGAGWPGAWGAWGAATPPGGGAWGAATTPPGGGAWAAPAWAQEWDRLRRGEMAVRGDLEAEEQLMAQAEEALERLQRGWKLQRHLEEAVQQALRTQAQIDAAKRVLSNFRRQVVQDQRDAALHRPAADALALPWRPAAAAAGASASAPATDVGAALRALKTEHRALTDEAVQHVEAQQQLEHALDAALAQADAPAPRAALPMGMPMFF